MTVTGHNCLSYFYEADYRQHPYLVSVQKMI